MPTERRPRALARNISMYPDQWALVESVAKEAGRLSLSAAVRLILSEWQQLKASADAPWPGDIHP